MVDISTKTYFQEIIKKFSFIEGIWVTDFEGALIASSLGTLDETSDIPTEEKNEEIEKNNKIKVSLSYIFNSAIDQTNKIEKWKTKNLVTIYDNYTIFQTKINKSVFIHFICTCKNFNYEIVKEISSEISEKLIKIEKEIENLTKDN
jgi:hypothetical protein